MKKLALAVSALAIGAVSASAADMAPLYTKAPPPEVAPAYDWSGFYVGGNGGYAWANNNTSSQVDVFFPGSAPPDNFLPLNSLDYAGGFGGGQVGYNFQRNSFVFGVELDIQGSGIRDHTTTLTSGSADVTALNFNQSINIDWFGTVRGRMGYTFGSTLLYATGGFAFGGVDYQTGTVAPVDGAFANASSNSVQTGYVVGAGVEHSFNPSWSIKAEYQYINLGREQLTGQAFGANGTASNQFIKTQADVNFSTVRVGINYHFLAPVVAKY